MSAPRWHDELGALTGEDLYHLTGIVTEARERTACAMALADPGDDRQPGLLGLYRELCDLFTDVTLQGARVTVPVVQAQGIIWRALFARNHPVPVSGH